MEQKIENSTLLDIKNLVVHYEMEDEVVEAVKSRKIVLQKVLRP